jgi:hypothetical protein
MHNNYSRWLEATVGERREAYAETIAFHAEQAFLLANEVDQPACETLGARSLELLQRALVQAREGPRARHKKPIVALEARIQVVEERLSALAQRRILGRR